MKPSSDYLSRIGSSNLQAEASSSSQEHPHVSRRKGNVTQLLLWREVAPVSRQGSRKLWAESGISWPKNERSSAKHGLIAWLEEESLRNCTAKYCSLHPAPRSTIAAAFSPDGTLLASTHGDHTVKIFCCKTGICLKTLCGHRRTPWVVRFHPSRSDILASGSLDNEVKIWNSNTAECIASHDFLRPIASIAFHAQGNLLAIASGHKLYTWQYNNKHAEDVTAPVIALRTRRSLRAVHFHPHGAPLLLTAEVIGLDSPDCPMTVATSAGYLQYPRPAIFLTPVQQPLPNSQTSGISISANSGGIPSPTSWIWPTTWLTDSGVESTQENIEGGIHHIPVADITGFNSMATPMDVLTGENENARSIGTDVDMLTTAVEGQRLPDGSGRGSSQAENNALIIPNALSRSETRGSLVGANFPMNQEERQIDGMNSWSNFQVPVLVGYNVPHSSFHVGGDSPGWEFPSLRGWIMGQTQAGFVQSALRSQHGILVVPSVSVEARGLQHLQEVNQGAMETPSAARNGGRFVNTTRGDASRINSAPGGRSIFSQHLQEANQGAMATSSAARNRFLTTTGGDVHGASGNSALDGGTTSVHQPQEADQGAMATLSTARSRFVTTTRGDVSRLSVNSITNGGANSVHVGILHGFASRDPNSGMIATEANPQLSIAAAAAATELPCTVKLRIWPHNMKHPTGVLDPQTCRLTIPHAVLCSEMGAHFSPCGRFLAVCVACILPSADSDTPFYVRPQTTSAGTSPTRHPISAQQVIYELRIYSLEDATFGQVLASRAIRAAHCLTSIQFSPASDHILLAYGRRHSSLLRSIVVNGTTTVPIFTILEVYRVSDMELVKVLPSAEDEVNVACFHPIVGGGLVYGTKEGRLRIFRHERSDKASERFRMFEDHIFSSSGSSS